MARQIDEHAAREAIARWRPDLRALVEAILEDLAGLQLHRVWLVDFPPQDRVALRARDEAGFGNTEFIVSDTRWPRCVDRLRYSLRGPPRILPSR